MTKRRLKRQLGLAQAVMLGTAGTIAAEIFVLTGHVAGIAGPASVLALLLVGVEWPRGGYRVEFQFCLGELGATKSFYYMSKHHDGIRKKAAQAAGGAEAGTDAPAGEAEAPVGADTAASAKAEAELRVRLLAKAEAEAKAAAATAAATAMFKVADLRRPEDRVTVAQEDGRAVVGVVCPSGIGEATVTAAGAWPASLTVDLRYEADRPFRSLERFTCRVSKGPGEGETQGLPHRIIRGAGGAVTVAIDVPADVRGWRALRLGWIDAYR